MKTFPRQRLTTGITSLKEAVSSVLEIRPYTMADMHLGGISINSLASDMYNPRTKPKLLQL
jgi:hypothetical protein